MGSKCLAVPKPKSLIFAEPTHENLTETPEQAPEGAGHGRPDFCEARSGMTEYMDSKEVIVCLIYGNWCLIFIDMFRKYKSW